jgi:hypothetical protein
LEGILSLHWERLADEANSALYTSLQEAEETDMPEESGEAENRQSWKQMLLRYPFLESPLERGLPEAWK